MRSDGVYGTAELRRIILPLAKKYGMAQAALFGSYARGEARPDSDIDVLLTRGRGFRPINVFALAEDLHESSGKDVDVYELGELEDGPFRDAVLREAVRL
ncbi:MAG: nucleotidyltransferase domain-containing protein [Olegusella sp.]|nr:nucleotidyltransferase domain-containing protein [Olegusella sp.]